MCFELHGYPSWWEKGKFQQGGARVPIKKQANHTASTGELPMVDMQALDKVKSKLKLSEGLSSSHCFSKADSGLNVTSQGIKSHQA